MSSSQKEAPQSRRHFLSALLEAGLSAPKAWLQGKTDAVLGVPEEARRRTAVSPPGSMSHEHLNSICDGCGLCMQHCPTHVLKASGTEYGPSGIAQPVMDFTQGWCGYDCTACGEICPKGAILPLEEDEKQSVQIGVAVLVKDLCVNSQGSSCTICADSCPASAIKMKEDYNSAPVALPDGWKRRIAFPVIEEALCIGCGLCEYKCPSDNVRAIHVEGLEIHQD